MTFKEFDTKYEAIKRDIAFLQTNHARLDLDEGRRLVLISEKEEALIHLIKNPI